MHQGHCLSEAKVQSDVFVVGTETDVATKEPSRRGVSHCGKTDRLPVRPMRQRVPLSRDSKSPVSFYKKSAARKTDLGLDRHAVAKLSQYLQNAVQVGQEGQIKSVIAKKGICIEGNVNIYGYLMTEGEGKIL